MITVMLAQTPPGTDMSGPQTIIGLLALAASLIIADWIKNRGKTQREESKVSELSQQTQLMVKQLDILKTIAEGQEYDAVKNAKTRKRIKVMSKMVKALHDKHIKPSSSNT